MCACSVCVCAVCSVCVCLLLGDYPRFSITLGRGVICLVCLVCIICVLFVWVVFLSFLYTSNTASMISTCTLMHMDTYYIVCICTCVTAYHLQIKCVYMLCVLRLNWPSISVPGSGPTVSGYSILYHYLSTSLCALSRCCRCFRILSFRSLSTGIRQRSKAMFCKISEKGRARIEIVCEEDVALLCKLGGA